MSLLPAIAAPSDARLATVHTFGTYLGGENPDSGLYRATDGNYYGTASLGGALGSGLIYQMNTAGVVTTIYNFSGAGDGGNPQSAVIMDPAGSLFGTTATGGSAGLGVVYKLDSQLHLTVLHNFIGGNDGANPSASLIIDPNGNLYGTTPLGGAANSGVVFEISPSGQETLLYTFTGGSDGANPYSRLLRDTAGNLYGTTQGGGSFDDGVIYTVSPQGQELTLFLFDGKETGKRPNSGVIADAQGNLYGTVGGGGAKAAGLVYKLDLAQRIYTRLYNIPHDGPQYTSDLVRDSAGNLYGTASGEYNSGGLVFKVSSSGHGSVVYSFPGGAPGSSPQAPVVIDPNGNLIGTTIYGGAGNAGVIFSIDPAGVETVLHTFPSGPDGSNPKSHLVSDGRGNFYGTTYYGGSQGYGVLYKLDALGNETIIHEFGSTPTDGTNPYGAVAIDSAGNIYGTTYYGGAYGLGSLLKIDPSGNETLLFSFSYDEGEDGILPYGDLILDSAGNLYGTTTNGGSPSDGTIFEVSPSGVLTTLYRFDNIDVSYGLVRDSSGYLFGAGSGGNGNSGAVYRLSPSGRLHTMYNFQGQPDGSTPRASLILDEVGNLYGTTVSGGTANSGTVFKVDPNDHETVLYSFTGGADGGAPYSSLLRDSRGRLFGTASAGRAAGAGVVFELDPDGTETVLHSFTGGSDGGDPISGLTFTGTGDLLGTTSGGGTHKAGVVYILPSH